MPARSTRSGDVDIHPHELSPANRTIPLFPRFAEITHEVGETMLRTLEQSTMRKVYLRLLPFAVLSYVLAYIDRSM
jgi:hypothetical protein